MAEQESVYLWSTTALTNASSDPAVNFAEGQLPGTLNNSNRAVMATIARFVKDINGSLTTAGSANAYTLTINGRQTPLATGHRLSFKASFSNTGAATLAVTNADAVALGAKAIRGPGDVALTANKIISGGVYDVRYDTAANSAAGAWVLLNPGSGDGDLLAANNLSDVASATTARTNIAAIGSVAVQKFTGSGTYTPTSGMRYCIIACWGGGAGGGGVAAANTSSGGAGGGGAGSPSFKVSTAAAIGASQTVTIGAAGAGGSAGANNGSAGGDTSVGALCIGKGGSPGLGSPGNAPGSGGLGGVAGTGDVTGTGMPGGTGSGAVVGTVYGVSGAGGSSQYGGGGRAVVQSSAGDAATGFGAGGGGAADGSAGAGAARAGGAGSAGLVIITEYF